VEAMKGKYRIRFIDGPNEGRAENIETLFDRITRYPHRNAKPITYYRKDNPTQKLAEYRYSVKP
jgi:hypothetical protein